MVPQDLIGYFTTSAAVAGSLVGLLFVSITLRYESILGSSADFRSRLSAGAAFTGLVNALTISLWALIPGTSLGYVAVISGVVSLARTLGRHAHELRLGHSLMLSFGLSAGVYLVQIVDGAYLIAQPRSSGLVDTLAYTLFGSFASALGRAWQLLQPRESKSNAPVVAARPADRGSPPG